MCIQQTALDALLGARLSRADWKCSHPSAGSMILGHRHQEGRYAAASQRCGSNRCQACRPYVLEDRCHHHGRIFLECDSLTRHDLPSKGAQQTLCSRLTRNQIPWVCLWLASGGCVVFTGSGSGLTPQEAVLQFAEIARGSCLAKDGRVITACRAWQIATAKTEDGKWKRLGKLGAASPTAAMEIITAHGGKPSSVNLPSSHRINWSVSWDARHLSLEEREAIVQELAKRGTPQRRSTPLAKMQC